MVEATLDVGQLPITPEELGEGPGVGVKIETFGNDGTRTVPANKTCVAATNEKREHEHPVLSSELSSGIRGELSLNRL